ncbi:glycosyltransferase [Paracrocinitomix mangrovi]|uniref:glycosyltransferase n=1 Tax=Paracrocinitomix mangrovi TaxID=2862509 RepID=UPI001C8D3F25|nr:glycosyltransferase [Paracrocinitomix mangrovi]UKN02079.1 glycosyltransferase [Paracrocinitomix mangrovi]
MSGRKRILVCIDWYEPGFKAGGPIRSVANMVNAMKDDFEFYILTSAFDLGEDTPYDTVKINEWFDNDGVFIKYLDKDLLNRLAIRRNILEIAPDILYLNSLFSKKFTLFPLMTARRNGISVVLAPRGMLGFESLEIKKGKKSTFINIAKLVGFYGKVTWHASTDVEAADIRKKFGSKSKIKIAQNIPISTKLELKEILNNRKPGKVRIVYISRISIIKNLHLAIQAVKQVASENPVEFHIYGNIEEPEYWEKHESELIDTEKIKIEYKGVAKPTELTEIYKNANYLILPTKHENYGHAIVEAWAHGCPVIISRNTPWKNLNIQGLGWDVDLKNFDNLIGAVQEAVDLDFASYTTMVTASYNYFKDVILDNDIIEANRQLFKNAN